MREQVPKLDRRRLLQILASAPVMGGAPFAVLAADPQPDGTVLLVAGPDGGRLDHWAAVIAGALSRFLPAGTGLRKNAAGAVDGVTGANQFDARALPDGTMLLLVPGRAILSWLAGDPRARFDVASWVPVMAGVSPAVLVSRYSAADLRPGDRLRVAASSPSGPGLSAVLGLDLMGLKPEPVRGLNDPAALRAALASGAVDAALIHGQRVPERAVQWGDIGVRPLCTLGAVDTAGAAMRDPAFPDLPHVSEMATGLRGAPPSGPLYTAWRASAAAARLDFALVLPPLTPAAMVAMWRRAISQITGTSEFRSVASADGVHTEASAAATASTAALAVDSEALTALRGWLAARGDWRPA